MGIDDEPGGVGTFSPQTRQGICKLGADGSGSCRKTRMPPPERVERVYLAASIKTE